MNGKSLAGFFVPCGIEMAKYIKQFDDDEWADAMRLENECDCYSCGSHIPEKTTVWPLQLDGYGFVWGSDGCYPDGASAMYACFECRFLWIDPPEEDEDASI